MSTIVQSHVETPARRPEAPLGPGAGLGEHEVSFELESPGGYRRTVTGSIAYLDDEAQTYMVRAPIGGLIRVPIRDIKKTTQA